MKQLNEGLRPMDLKEMVHPTFEIDTFKSKMGEDRDVCVISFTVKDRGPAKDLMEFVEKSYSFVLDADLSSGENNNGEYSVFVELDRTPKLAEQIKDLTYGIEKLTGIENFKFRYHKQDTIKEASEEAISATVPNTPMMYDGMMTKIKTESIKNFFNKTLMDDLTLEGDVITIHKPFDQKIQLKILDQEDQTILETEAIRMDTEAVGEIFWLTKVLGDYNISKVGDKLVFDNKGQTMLLQRI